MFEKSVGEFTVSASDPYPLWIRIEHEFSDGYVRFNHEELDDLIYALNQAQKHVAKTLAAKKGECDV